MFFTRLSFFVYFLGCLLKELNQLRQEVTYTDTFSISPLDFEEKPACTVW
jgi:hypothetical protein